MTPATLLALLSAVLYGAGDFVGGVASRRASTLAVVFVSQFAGAVALLVLLPLLPSATVGRGDLIWGAAAGLAGGIGVALLYRALAIGTMSVVAPTTAVCAVVIPVAVSILLGERPSSLSLTGVAMALMAIVLVSQASTPAESARHHARSARVLTIAIASGVAIGVFYLALARTARDAGLWPLLAARGASAVVFVIMALVSGHGALRMPGDVLPMAILCGLLDMTANALYLVATRGGSLSTIVTLASLYPASTVVLARLVLRERLSRLQIAGVSACLVAVVLIVGG